MPIAYSYQRFSSDAQSEGDSLRRQKELARKYVDENTELGLTLDTALNMTDLGVSAFKGDNMTTGALGKFLVAVHQGLIPRGSYLLIEAFDRFSREQPNKAAGALLNLVNNGIVVVTLNNRQVFREEDFIDGTAGLVAFMGAFIAMEGAHREQVNKGKRISAAWSNKWIQLKADIAAGKKPKALTKLRPFWLDEDLKPIKDKVAVLRDIFDKRGNQGWGKVAIATYLNDSKVPTPKGKTLGDGAPKKWNASTVDKLLASKAPAGVFVNAHGEEIDGYYPSVVDEVTYTKVRALAGVPVAKGQDVTRRHPLTGLVKHLQCGQSLRRINKGAKGGAVKMICTHCKDDAGVSPSKPFTLMLHAVEVALRGLENSSLEDVKEATTLELLELEASLSGWDEEVSESYDTFKRIKTLEAKNKYEAALMGLADARKALAELRSSNLAIVVNMEDQALMKHQGGIGAAPSVVSSCVWNSSEDTLEVTSLSKRKSKVWLEQIK
jgi:DNA invertase Pin-like site-specific DNA recombinase